MKKTALFLSLCALLAACDSGYKKDGPDEVSQKTASSAELKSDSTTGRNVAAVANQMQVDTSTTKIGTSIRSIRRLIHSLVIDDGSEGVLFR